MSECADSIEKEKDKNLPTNRLSGLTQNINCAESLYWAPRLNLNLSSTVMLDAGDQLLEAAKKDFEVFLTGHPHIDFELVHPTFHQYMKRIQKFSNLYLQSEKLCDRREIIDYLAGIFEDSGHFICILGGKSYGKSTCLRSLATRTNVKNRLLSNSFTLLMKEGYTKVSHDTLQKDPLVLIVDLREGDTSILDGLIRTINRFNDSPTLKKILTGVIQQLLVSDRLQKYVSKQDLQDLEMLYHGLKEVLSPSDKADIVKSLIEALTEESLVTIIIDEANLAFNQDLLKGEKELRKERVEKLQEAALELSLFTLFTKQSRKMNVILASSEHSFPFRLMKEMKFNLKNCSRFIFFNEICPKDCYDLLVNEWKVGPHLALALLDIYGGQFLIRNRWFFFRQVIPSFHHDLLSQSQLNPLHPLHKEAQSALLIRSDHLWPSKYEADVRTLTTLAERGFYPIQKAQYDPIAEKLSQLNIAGVVERNSIVPEIPKELWKGE